MVAGGAAPSPVRQGIRPGTACPASRRVGRDVDYWLTYFDRNPGERYVSDGDPATITVPAARREKLRTDLPKTRKVVER